MNTEGAPSPIAALRVRRAQQDPAWVRWSLTALALGVVGLLVVVPVVNVFVQAFGEGWRAYWSHLFGEQHAADLAAPGGLYDLAQSALHVRSQFDPHQCPSPGVSGGTRQRRPPFRSSTQCPTLLQARNRSDVSRMAL